MEFERKRAGCSSIVETSMSNLCISTKPADLLEGLFGQVILYVFETLPYLNEHGIFPDWKIRAEHYGCADEILIPGVLDLAYAVPSSEKREVNLIQLRKLHRHTVGHDWRALSELWNKYFRIPTRITEQAEQLGALSSTLGIHYRGNDKHYALWDTNPVGHEDYLAIIRDFVERKSSLQRIFLATDDYNFYHYLKDNISIEVINLGEVKFHKDKMVDSDLTRADRAMLDCYILSRCGAVLLTSSALSSFAKILNPDLEIYRVAAAKFFNMVPYFPVSYIPRYKTDSKQITEIVNRLMQDDWTQNSRARLFSDTFVSRSEWSPTIRRAYNAVESFAQWIPGGTWLVLKIPKVGYCAKLFLGRTPLVSGG